MWDMNVGWWAPPLRCWNTGYSTAYNNGYCQREEPANKENVEGWKHKVIDDWNSLDVLYWFLSELQQLQVKDPAAVKLENFVQTKGQGSDLKKLSLDDFKKMIPGYGDVLYYRLQTKVKEEEMVWDDTLTCYRSYPDPYILTDLDKKSHPANIKLEAPRYYYLEKNSYKPWIKKNINEWTSRDVLDWLLYELHLLKVSYQEAYGLERFAGLEGCEISRLTKEEFEDMIPQYGETLYLQLQMRKRFNEDYQHLKTDLDARVEKKLDATVIVEAPNIICKAEPPAEPPAATCEPSSSHSHGDPLFTTASPIETTSCSNQVDEKDIELESNSSPADLSHEYDSEASTEEKTPPPKRPVGRPRGSLKKQRSREKVGRVWEFIRDLLMDARYNPSIISWEDRDQGVFRFENSEQVANLWGCKRSNPRMNYGYFTRSIRHNYKKGYLLPVEKKRRVYQFGPKSSGWRLNYGK